MSGIPYSFTAHGSDLHGDRTMFPAKVASAAFVVAVSAYNKELIVTECGEHQGDKVVVIHCGTDSSTFARRAGRAKVEAEFDILRGARSLLGQITRAR